MATASAPKAMVRYLRPTVPRMVNPKVIRVGARGLGRGRDRDDTDSAEAEAIAAGDEPMVDAAAQDTGAETDAQDTDAETDGDEPMGFPGGPRDPSVLTEYADHVAGSVWSGQVFIRLKLVNFYFF